MLRRTQTPRSTAARQRQVAAGIFDGTEQDERERRLLELLKVLRRDDLDPAKKEEAQRLLLQLGSNNPLLVKAGLFEINRRIQLSLDLVLDKLITVA